MGILDRWRRSGDDAPDAALTQSMARMIALNPNLGLASRWRERLAPSVRMARTYLHDVVAALPPPRDMDSRTWADDPYIHALFATPHDVTLTVTRSPEVRACFEQTPQTETVVAILGFAMTERHTLGAALEGDVMRSEVPRTTVSFHDYTLRLCAPALTPLCEEIEARLLDQLAMEAIRRVASERSQRDRLEQERVLLRTRLSVLRKGAAGAEGMLAVADTPDAGERARLEAELSANERALAELGLPGTEIDRQLDALADVLRHADAYFHILVRRLCLDAMNVVATTPEESSRACELQLQCARVPGDPPIERLFALVRVQRADLLPSTYLLDRAEQFL